MATIGQPGAAPPPAGAPAPNAGAPVPQASSPGAPAPDPWGFNAAAANAPEHLRPMLQAEFARLTPQLDQRMQTFAPVEPYLEQIGPLLQPDPETNAVPLVGLVNLFNLFNDPEGVDAQGNSNLDALADWWEAVGDHFDLFDPEDGGNVSGAAAAPAGNDGGLDFDAIEDPGMRAIVQQLVQTNQQLQAEVGEFRNTLQQTSQQQQMNERAEQIKTDLQTRMKAAKIDGHDNLRSPQAVDIMRIAAGYGENPQAIELAVNDYARMTGRQPSTPVDPNANGLEALQQALSAGITNHQPAPAPGPSLTRGNADNEPEPVRGWDDARAAAMQRLTAQG